MTHSKDAIYSHHWLHLGLPFKFSSLCQVSILQLILSVLVCAIVLSKCKKLKFQNKKEILKFNAHEGQSGILNIFHYHYIDLVHEFLWGCKPFDFNRGSGVFHQIQKSFPPNWNRINRKERLSQLNIKIIVVSGVTVVIYIYISSWRGGQAQSMSKYHIW